jgi:hypothetical protein
VASVEHIEQPRSKACVLRDEHNYILVEDEFAVAVLVSPLVVGLPDRPGDDGAEGDPKVADRLSSILDQPIAYDPVSPDRFKTSLLESGRPPWLANEFVELAAAREGLTAPVTDAVHEATGENPRTFDAFVRDHAEELTPDSLS